MHDVKIICFESMMMMSSRERRVEAKQEGESTNDARLGKAACTSSSRQWPGFRNPRIVRVSRSFGGKDRHSKVCTIRGLRDRRIRLSVPTAIQLYDLQDRLGLSQPSKVIDWLLDATKYDIDKLPPLQIPQGFGHQFHQQMIASQDHSNIAPFLDPGAYKINSNVSVDGEAQAKYNWDIDAVMSRGKSKEVRSSSCQQDDQIVGNYNDSAHVSAQNLFPMGNDHSSQNMGNYYSLEPSNLSLSHFGSHGFLSHTDNPLSIASASSFLPSNSLALPSGSQLFLCPPALTPSLFHPYINTTMVAESDPRHIQFLSSTSQHMLPTKPLSSNFKDKDDNRRS